MIQSKEKIIELGKSLPWGAKKEISKRTGISEKTVANFFNGSNVRYDKALQIVNSANKLLKKLSLKKIKPSK